MSYSLSQRDANKKSYALLFLFALAVSIPILLYFFNFHGQFSSNQGEWSNFGSYISGIYGTLGFIALVYTTYVTGRQFRIQSADNTFFKLYDSLQNRISSASFEAFGDSYSGHNVLKVIVNNIYDELSKESIAVARMLLCKTPENVSDVHYMKIFEAIKGDGFMESFCGDKSDFIADITREPGFNYRWERLKWHIGSVGEETGRLRDALKATGSVNFYKIPFEERRHHYRAAMRSVLNEHGPFIDGYFRNIKFLISFARSAENRILYFEFIRSQLTKYEFILIFYCLMAGDDNEDEVRAFKEAGVLEGLLSIDCRAMMIDLPDEDALGADISSAINGKG